jgi:hypothetical protein
MCMPRLALGSWPEISQVMVVGEDSDSCSKVTVPETLESPRTTATTRVIVNNGSAREPQWHAARSRSSGGGKGRSHGSRSLLTVKVGAVFRPQSANQFNQAQATPPPEASPESRGHVD